MPKGPKGEKRPADVIGAAVTVSKIITGEDELPSGRRKSGKAGGKARAKKFSAEERQRAPQVV